MKKFLLLLLLISVRFPLSAQEQWVIPSRHLGTNDTVWVAKPTHFDANRTYPVIYMLHGHGGDYKSYLGNPLYRELADRYGMIIVAPDGLKDSWFINAPHLDQPQFESFFFEELLPFIEKRYPVDPNNRFITGLSMGGHGALTLFIKHPELFRSAGSCSGVLNLRYSGNRDGSLAKLLGKYSETNELFDRYSVNNQLERLKGTTKSIVIDCGTEDYLYPTAKAARKLCDSLQIPCISLFAPGKHDSNHFDSLLPIHFLLFSRMVQQ